MDVIANPWVRVILANADREAVGPQETNHQGFGPVKVIGFAEKIMAGNAKLGYVLDHARHSLDGEAFRSFDVHLKKVNVLNLLLRAQFIERTSRHCEGRFMVILELDDGVSLVAGPALNGDRAGFVHKRMMQGGDVFEAVVATVLLQQPERCWMRFDRQNLASLANRL